MKPNNLRLGSLVQLYVNPTDKKKSVVKVKSIYFDDNMQTEFIEAHNGKRCNIETGIEPIKITEKLLKKLGFEDWGLKDVNHYEKYRRFVLYNVLDGTSNFEVHLFQRENILFNNEYVEFSIDDNQRIMWHSTEYLHDIQNAFYFTAGYELDVTALISK